MITLLCDCFVVYTNAFYASIILQHMERYHTHYSLSCSDYRVQRWVVTNVAVIPEWWSSQAKQSSTQ